MLLEDELKALRLRYMSDHERGLGRRRAGKYFSYYDKHDEHITDANILKRIKSIGIPPAWEQVWIAPYANAHLQATGYDAKGRKQYLYHSEFVALSQGHKFERIFDFAESLPKIRQHIQRDLTLPEVPKEKVLATIVWLLGKTLIRIGNKEYEKENKSYGLTTLKNRHISFSPGSVTFAFKGKSGIYHTVSVRNQRVASILKTCQELPGQQLFQYLDEEGNRQTVSSEDVNDYLKFITDKDITAKDFRTWGGTNTAAHYLDKIGLSEDEKQLKSNITKTVKSVAGHLRNTPATCRKYYIHPNILSAYNQGYVVSNINSHNNYSTNYALADLNDEENCVLCMIHLFNK